MDVITLPISQIQVGNNIRDPNWVLDIEDLKNDIKRHGLLSPIEVWELPEGAARPAGKTHHLIWGHRRLQACMELGYEKIDAILASQDVSPMSKYMRKVSENLIRRNLTPLEEAQVFHEITTNFGWSPKTLAEYLSRTPGHISQRLSLLKLDDEVLTALKEDLITVTHARELGRIPDHNQQRQLLKAAKAFGIEEFRRHIKDKLKDMGKGDSGRGRPRKYANPTIDSKQEEPKAKEIPLDAPDDDEMDCDGPYVDPSLASNGGFVFPSKQLSPEERKQRAGLAKDAFSRRGRMPDLEEESEEEPPPADPSSPPKRKQEALDSKRTKQELSKTLKQLDKSLKKSSKSEDKVLEAYYMGAIRGVSWAFELTGSDNLFDP